MRHYAVADDVVFEETENGWVMVVYSEDGDVFRFKIQHLALSDAFATIAAWQREGEAAKASMPERT